MKARSTIPVVVGCPACKGTGKKRGGLFWSQDCLDCGTSGKVTRRVPLPPADPTAVAKAMAVEPHETRAQRRDRLRGRHG